MSERVQFLEGDSLDWFLRLLNLPRTRKVCAKWTLGFLGTSKKVPACLLARPQGFELNRQFP